MMSSEPWYVISMRTPASRAYSSRIGSSSAFSEPERMRSTRVPLPSTASAPLWPPAARSERLHADKKRKRRREQQKRRNAADQPRLFSHRCSPFFRFSNFIVSARAGENSINVVSALCKLSIILAG